MFLAVEVGKFFLFVAGIGLDELDDLLNVVGGRVFQQVL